MRTRTGTGVVIALFLAISLLCAVGLVAQDNLLTNSTSNNKTGGVCSVVPATNVTQALCTAASGTWSTTNSAVDCVAYGSDGVTCVAGQYYHSDNAKLSTAWASTATSTAYGNWVTGITGSSSGCLSCHHGNVAGASTDLGPLGGGYLIGGHKNILRKVVPGQTLLDTQGNLVANVIDHSSNKFTLSQTTGQITGATGTFTANYLAGWVADGSIDVFGTNVDGTANSTLAYGSCARCHSTGYRWDGIGPEPSVNGGTTKLPNAFNYPAGQKSGDTTVASSWYLTGIQCERCHKADMQYDATMSSIANANIGTAAAPVNPLGRISHLNNVLPTSVTADPNSGLIAGTDFYLHVTTGTTATRPQVNPPVALTCVECHQAYSTWTSKVAGKAGQVHLTPLPGFESLAPKSDGVNYSSTKEAKGQFSATWGCTGATGTVATNDYDGCIAAGGTVAYVPGGMSHGAVATILNSPHGRVTGYVDLKNSGTADTTLTIKGGTVNDPTSLVNGVTFAGQFNTFFASAGTTGASASATRPDGKTNGVSGSCAGCHDIHSYMPDYFEPAVNATNVSKAPLKNCTACHASHGKVMAHPVGNGTPYAALEGTTGTGTFGAQESCNICHFSKKTGTEYHFLRINADPTYSTFPDARTYYTTTGSGQFGKLNTYPESFTNPVTYQPGTYPAVGLDVDIACGQCHVGGDGSKNPYGITPYAGDNADGSGFVAPRPYSRAWLAAKAASMHATAAANPTITPALPAAGGPTTITISTTDQSEGSYATIWYTTDGTIPSVTLSGETFVAAGSTQKSTTGSVSIPVTATTTVYAMAGGPATYSFSMSQVVGGTYAVQVAPTPTIAPSGAALTYPATVSVKLSDSVTAASICYTTDGTAPVAGTNCVANGTSIVVNKSMVIKALATAAGYGNSNVASATFTVKPPTPSWSNVAPAKFPGTYVGAVTAALTDADANAQICYTTDGTTPTAASTCVASGAPITVSASETIKAIAVDGTAVSSMTSGTFVIK